LWKKIKGCKRHIVADVMGNLLKVVVSVANIHDMIAGCRVFKSTLKKYPSIFGVCWDEGYVGRF
jgi:hypothetical protein